MENFKETLEQVKVKALKTIEDKLKSDISVLDLINICACLNNFKSEEDFVTQFLRAKQLIDGNSGTEEKTSEKVDG